jgi:hypothetical protein
VTARTLSIGRAEQQLPEPERETLLSNSTRTVQQDAARQGGSYRGIAQSAAQGLMTVHLNDRHAG